MLVNKDKKCTNNNVLTEPNNEANEINLETNLLCSTAHIAMARVQHTSINECIRLVKQDNTNNLHFNRRRYIITFDYAQNLELPHFSDE